MLGEGLLILAESAFFWKLPVCQAAQGRQALPAPLQACASTGPGVAAPHPSPRQVWWDSPAPGRGGDASW